MTEIKRDTLLKIASLVRPALKSDNYMPALQHVRFDGEFATAFNDISAIAVACEMDVKRCLPGETLIKALQSFNAEKILFQQKEGDVIVSSGRSRLTLPTLGLEAFPLKWPEEGEDYRIKLAPSIVRGIERCLMNVGNDPTHPECMGVTLDSHDGGAVLYATDSFTISRYTPPDAELDLPGDAPVILPTFFCEQLVSLAKHYSEEKITLVIHPGAMIAEFGKQARLFTRNLVDKEPLDFPGMMKKELTVKAKDLVVIPDAFDAALARALLVVGADLDKVTTIEITNKGFTMHSSSNMGDSDDVLRAGDEDDEFSFNSPDTLHVDPTLVARGLKACTKMGFLKGSLALADKEGRFVHLIAYCSKNSDKKK